MTIRLALPAAALAAAFALCAWPSMADEPAQTAAQPRIVEELVPDVKEARVRLAGEIDRSLQANAYADLVTTLIAANPLGIDVAAPDATLQAQLGLIKDQGVVVTSVPEESQGAKAGVKVHDLLLAIDGQGVSNAADLQKLLEASVGKEVQLMLRRGGKVLDLRMTPQKPQTAALFLDAAYFNATLAHAERYRIGVTLSEADETLRSQLGLAQGEGLVVTEVFENSAAAQAGIRAHDVLTMLDGKRLATVDAVNTQIQEIKEKAVELRLLRGGKEMTLRVTPRKTQEAAFSNQPVTVWETNRCKECHQNPHQLADPHMLMGWKLGANNSAWTDGKHSKLFWYENAFRNQIGAAPSSADQPPAMEQLQSLKSQLAEMQKTLSALESTLQQPPTKEEEKK